MEFINLSAGEENSAGRGERKGGGREKGREKKPWRPEESHLFTCIIQESTDCDVHVSKLLKAGKKEGGKHVNRLQRIVLRAPAEQGTVSASITHTENCIIYGSLVDYSVR